MQGSNCLNYCARRMKSQESFVAGWKYWKREMVSFSVTWEQYIYWLWCFSWGSRESPCGYIWWNMEIMVFPSLVWERSSSCGNRKASEGQQVTATSWRLSTIIHGIVSGEEVGQFWAYRQCVCSSAGNCSRDSPCSIICILQIIKIPITVECKVWEHDLTLEMCRGSWGALSVMGRDGHIGQGFVRPL